MPISLFILKRLLYALPTLLAVSMIGFFLMRYDVDLGTWPLPVWSTEQHLLEQHSSEHIDRVASDQASTQGRFVLKPVHLRFKNPIDPLAELKHNPQISPAVYDSEKKRLGLDQPLHVQYWLWLSHLCQVDVQALKEGRWLDFFKPNLGTTFNGEDVASLLFERATNTVILNSLVVLVTWLIALPLGVYSALKWRTVTDRLMTVWSSVGMAAPTFVVALLLAVITVKTGLLPLGGLASEGAEDMAPLQRAWDYILHLILPVGVLAFSGVAGLQRQMRGNLLDVLQAEYVRVARAKGLPENQVIYRHAVRTSLNPLVTMLGYEFSALLSGSLLVEMVLNYPGLGQFIYQAVLDTDTNVVMASLVMSAGMLVLGNLLADILLKFIDPRIELA